MRNLKSAVLGRKSEQPRVRQALGTGFLVVALFFSIEPQPYAMAAGPWTPESLVAQTISGGGVGASLGLLVLDSNPAGLAFVDRCRRSGLALGMQSDQDAVDAWRFYGIDNEDDFSRFFAEDPLNPDPAVGAGFRADMQRFAGRTQVYDLRFSLANSTRKNFGVGLYAGTSSELSQRLGPDGSPLATFEYSHASEAGLKLGFGRFAGEALGGQVALGMAADIGVVQRRDETIMDFESFDTVVRQGMKTFYFTDPAPDLRYSTRIGFQWQGKQDFGRVYQPAFGMVLLDLLGSNGGRQLPAQLSGGVCLVPLKSSLPWLIFDYGSIEGLGEGSSNSSVFGAVEMLGPLALAFGTSSEGQRWSASLNLGLLKMEYQNIEYQHPGTGPDRQHAFRLVIGTSSRPTVGREGLGVNHD